MPRLLILFFLCPIFSIAQKLPSIEEKTSGMKKLDGYFTCYLDENAGKLWMEVNRVDSEFLYQTSLPSGIGSNDIGLDRGLLGDTKVAAFKRYGRKLLLVQPNYAYRALSADPAEKKAAQQSFATSTLWGFTIEAASDNRFLVDASEFLLRDAMNVVNRLRNLKQGLYSLDKNRSALYPEGSKNFPRNTELEATITFVNTDGQPGPFLQSVVPSPDAITVRMHHSFVQLPDPGYTPRTFDPRSSFIPVSYFDFSTPVTEPIDKYLVMRHRLRKKDPQAARSEAVNPIVYYLDNGTPEPIRSALMEGARWWNQAFEAAGYINAFQVKLLPDSADPMDIRYNMINWVHRSTRGWSYGYSVVDPRTGEIIKGNVTLGSLRVRQDYLIAQGLLAPFENGVPADNKMLTMALQRLSQLAAHEVGHTLGLMHNYAASVSGRASVMDYPHPQVEWKKDGTPDLSDAYAKGIGSWDKVSITWGYQDFPAATNETIALNRILEEARKNGLQFISDRDANTPGGIHPAAHLWDNGTSAAAELKRVLQIRAKALQQFGSNNIRPGMPMAQLEDVLVPVYLFHRYQLIAAVKVVGGLNYSYALRGDGQLITAPVPAEEQRKALQAVLECIDPKTLVLPSSLIGLIPPRPAGYAYTRELFKKRTGLAFDALAPAETAADLAFSFLFQTERLNRLSEFSQLHKGLGLEELLQSVLAKTWKAPRLQGMEGLIQLQNEQLLLTYLLAVSVDDNASFITRATISKTLQELKKYMEGKNKSTTDTLYGGHLLLALDRMKAPEKAKPTLHLEIPPGAPIGCDQEF